MNLFSEVGVVTPTMLPQGWGPETWIGILPDPEFTLVDSLKLHFSPPLFFRSLWFFYTTLSFLYGGNLNNVRTGEALKKIVLPFLKGSFDSFLGAGPPRTRCLSSGTP